MPSDPHVRGARAQWVLDDADFMIGDEAEDDGVDDVPAGFELTDVLPGGVPGMVRNVSDVSGATTTTGASPTEDVDRARAISALRELSGRSLISAGASGSSNASSAEDVLRMAGLRGTPSITPSPLPGVTPDAPGHMWHTPSSTVPHASHGAAGGVAFKRHRLAHHVTELSNEDLGESKSPLAAVVEGPREREHAGSNPEPPLRRVTSANSSVGRERHAVLPNAGDEEQGELPKTNSLYSIVQGPEKMTDPGLAFFVAAVKHNVVLQGVAVLLALCTIPPVLAENWVHNEYLDYWSASGANVTVATEYMMTPGVFGDCNMLYVVFASLSAAGSIAAAVSLPGLWLLVLGEWRAPRAFWIIGSIYVVFFLWYDFYFFKIASDGARILHTMFGAVGFLTSIVLGIMMGLSMREYLRFPDIWKPLIPQLLLYGGAIFAYNVTVPRWFLDPDATTSQLVLIRLVIHPLIMELLQTSVRVLTLAYPDHLKESTMIVFLVPCFVMLHLVGRFLVASMPNLGGMVLMSLAQAALSTALRVTMGPRDYLLLRLFCRSDVEARGLVFSRRRRRMKADILTIDIITESVGIVAGTIIVFLYNVRAQAANPSSSALELLVSLVLQLGISLAGDLVPPIIVFMGRGRIGNRSPMRVEVPASTPGHRDRAAEMFMEMLAVQTMRHGSRAGAPTHKEGGVVPDVEYRPQQHVKAGTTPATPDGSDDEGEVGQVPLEGGVSTDVDLDAALEPGRKPTVSGSSLSLDFSCSGLGSSGNASGGRITDGELPPDDAGGFVPPPLQPVASTEVVAGGEFAADLPVASSSAHRIDVTGANLPTSGRLFENLSSSAPPEVGGVVDRLGLQPGDPRLNASAGRVVPQASFSVAGIGQHHGDHDAAAAAASPGSSKWKRGGASSATAAALELSLDSNGTHHTHSSSTESPKEATTERGAHDDAAGEVLMTDGSNGIISHLRQTASWKRRHGYARAATSNDDGIGVARKERRDNPDIMRQPSRVVDFALRNFLRLSRNQTNFLNVWHVRFPHYLAVMAFYVVTWTLYFVHVYVSTRADTGRAIRQNPSTKCSHSALVSLPSSFREA